MWAVWRFSRAKLVFTMALVVLTLTAGAISHVQAPLMPVDPGPLQGRVIAIDPGHGGLDGGCGNSDHLEKDLALDFAKRLAPLLRLAGAAVVLTRSRDVELSRLYPNEKTRQRRDLMARVQIARMNDADLLVSLHLNAARRPDMKGSMVFYQPSIPMSRMAATQVQSYLKVHMPGNQNAVLPARFFILRQLEAVGVPAILVEIGFLSNVDDKGKVLDATMRESVVEAIRDGIVAALVAHRSSTADLAPVSGALLSESAESFSGGECPDVGVEEDVHG